MKTDIEKNDLRGKVKQVVQQCYKASGTPDSIIMGSAINDYHFPRFIKKYNEHGNLIEVNRGNGGTIVLYKYDESGRLVEENIFNSTNTFLMKHAYVYDGKGNLTEMNKYYSNGKLFDSYGYKYDGKGNMIEGYFDEKNRDAGILSSFSYDDNNKLQEEYNSKGELISKFDSNGNKIEHYEYWPEKEYNTKTLKNYNNENKLVESKIFNYMGNPIGKISQMKYDEKSNVIESCDLYHDGSIDSRINFSYEYDHQNNWVTKIEFRNYKHDYNERGDWVKIELPNPEPINIIKRELEYWN